MPSSNGVYSLPSGFFFGDQGRNDRQGSPLQVCQPGEPTPRRSEGLEIICQNVGLSLREVAALLGVAPSQGQGVADSTHDSVERFAAAHPNFEALADDICFFIESGRADDLEEAYSLAERFNLAPSEPSRRWGARKLSARPYMTVGGGE
jgi:hypothetical protein